MYQVRLQSEQTRMFPRPVRSTASEPQVQTLGSVTKEGDEEAGGAILWRDWRDVEGYEATVQKKEKSRMQVGLSSCLKPTCENACRAREIKRVCYFTYFKLPAMCATCKPGINSDFR